MNIDFDEGQTKFLHKVVQFTFHPHIKKAQQAHSDRSLYPGTILPYPAFFPVSREALHCFVQTTAEVEQGSGPSLLGPSLFEQTGPATVPRTGGRDRGAGTLQQ